jgi:hypothetical protein
MYVKHGKHDYGVPNNKTDLDRNDMQYHKYR